MRDLLLLFSWLLFMAAGYQIPYHFYYIFHWIRQFSHRFGMSVCLSVCLFVRVFVTSQNILLQRLWRPLVKEHIPNIGLLWHNFSTTKNLDFWFTFPPYTHQKKKKNGIGASIRLGPVFPVCRIVLCGVIIDVFRFIYFCIRIVYESLFSYPVHAYSSSCSVA